MHQDEITQLINRVALGDRAAFNLLYKQTSPKLFAICLRILKNKEKAEEAIQEVYIKIWHRSKTFETGFSSSWAWLAAIARYQSIDTVRRIEPKSVNIEDVYDLEDTGMLNPEQNAVISDQGRQLGNCLAELEDNHAIAVRRAYVEGLSYLELADELDIPINTVRTWLRRSLLKLRECMQR